MIYKEAKARLCRASGIDTRLISVQIEFHGQPEGTDAARRDWHPHSRPLHPVFGWGTSASGAGIKPDVKREIVVLILFVTFKKSE